MTSLKTLSQAFQWLVVIASVLFQYFWFIENTSPIQLYARLFDNAPDESIGATIPETSINDNEKPYIEDIIDNTQTGNGLLSDLISYEFESTLKALKYKEYKQKSTMYLKFWSLFFETLSNQNAESVETLSFRNKAWQKEPILIQTRDIFESFAPFEHVGTAFASKMLNSETVVATLNDNEVYESPFTMFFHSKLHSANMDLSVYKERRILLNATHLSTRLSHDTLVINNAALTFKNVALMESIIMKTMQIPTNTNAYISGPRSEDNLVSSSVHSDRQNIFIIQTQGQKRWQVWEPKLKNPRFEQIRGKDDNIVSEGELSELKLLYDVV